MCLTTPWLCPQELGHLGEDANVFKLVGPVLVKQDMVEAKSNVSKRMEYIKGEVERVDQQIKALESKQKERERDVSGKDGVGDSEAPVSL